MRPLIMGVAGARSEKDTVGYYYYGGRSKLQAVRLGKWKLRLTKKGPELYDLEADIGEQNNLAEQQGAVVEHLSKMMLAFDKELKANPRPAGAEGGRDVFEMPRIVNNKNR